MNGFHCHVIRAMHPERYDLLLPADQWKRPLAVPQGECGEYRVVHQNQDPEFHYDFIGSPKRVRFDGPTTLQMLYRGDRLLMSDSPSEVEDMEDLAHRVLPGRVCIAGLGLGVLAALVAARDDVEAVTVVEIAPEVITLVGPHLPAKAQVVRADYREWLKQQSPGTFSSAILDIWGTPDFSLDDLRDMLTLWRETQQRLGIKHGGVWGADILISELQDEVRGYDEPLQTADALDDAGFPDIADDIRDHHCLEDWLEEDEDGEYSTWAEAGGDDNAIEEAFHNLYHL